MAVLLGGIFSVWGLLAWVACAAFAGHLAGEKGRCGFCWFVLGIVFGPLALIAAVGLPVKGPTRRTHAQCHMCHEFVLPHARKCKHCQTEFAPDEHTQGLAEQEGVGDVVKAEGKNFLTSPETWFIVTLIVVLVYLSS